MNDFISLEMDVLPSTAPTPAAGTDADASPDVEIYDPPMCCPTGLCGPTLDQTLLDVSDMIQMLQDEGVQVERYQLSSQPHKFTKNPAILNLVRAKHMDALPITTVRGQIVKVGSYPTLSEVRAFLKGIDQS